MPSFFPLTNDFVFKGTFSVLLDSLAALLQALCPWLAEEEFEEISLPDTHRKRRHAVDKECVLDICVRLKSGRMIAIEMQMAPHSGLFSRAQFVSAKMMVEEVKKGSHYVGIPQMITIFIMDDRLFKGKKRKKYRYEYRVVEVDDGDELPNSQVFLFFELSDLPEASDGTAAWDWLRLIKARTPEELRARGRKEPVMAEVAMKVLEMSADARKRHLAFRRELWRLDEATRRRDAETAHDRGLAKGKAEGKAEVARSMLRAKMALARIAELTGLSKTEVKRLAGE
jgi:predicted transposase/invertase (TIGR01784 family)